MARDGGMEEGLLRKNSGETSSFNSGDGNLTVREGDEYAAARPSSPSATHQQHTRHSSARESKRARKRRIQTEKSEFPKNFVKFGRQGRAYKSGGLLHYFGQDDWISRSYNVAWTSFVLVVTFLVLVDPGIFGAAVIGTGSDIADALIRLAYSLFAGLTLNFILLLNRPSRTQRALYVSLFWIISINISMWSRLKYIFAHGNPTTYGLVQESFAIMLAIMLVVADLSSIVVVGHIFRVDRLVGWWPLSTTFSEELRVRQALYLSHQFKRTSQIPTSIGKDGEYSEADWEGEVTTDKRPAKSWQEKLSSVVNSLETSLGEDGMFSYPSAVLIAMFVTPILLVWLYAVSLHLVSILVSLLDDARASLASFDGRAELAQSVVRANAAAMCGNDTQCTEALEEILSVVGTARSTAGSLHSWIGNAPDVMHITFLVSTSVSFVLVLSLVVRNVIDFKVWNLRIWAGQKLGGFNVTTGRKGHDIARSAEYVAVFASTHIIGYATMSLTLGVLFTLVAYSKTWVLIVEHMQFLLTYIIVYVIVYYILRTVVGNTWLSDGEYAKRPRRLSNFLSGLSVYYITSALLAAVSRLVIAVPYFFYMFCRVHYSPFAGAWQRYDYPFRASQSLLQHHTRSQNAHMIGFAGALVQSTEPHRKSAMAASEARLIAGEAVGATPLEAPRWHNHGARARNQWRVAYTLVANPELIALRAGATPVDSAE